MNSKNTIDLIVLFEKLINDLKPYANEESINLCFKSNLEVYRGLYNSIEVYGQFSILIKRIIVFTPEFQNVTVILDSDKDSINTLSVKITNTGMNLLRMREIINELKYDVHVAGTKDKGTLYSVKVPMSPGHKSTVFFKKTDINNLGFIPYYKEIETKLSAYFKEIENLQAIADKKGEKEGLFLRETNAVIQSRMSDNNFKVNTLASAMALSRAQLFRKVKALTNMSPSEYLLYFRLHTARDLLEAKQKELNVSEVAYSVGFISKSHFSRSFQIQFGVSPSAYKKMQQ